MTVCSFLSAWQMEHNRLSEEQWKSTPKQHVLLWLAIRLTKLLVSFTRVWCSSSHQLIFIQYLAILMKQFSYGLLHVTPSCRSFLNFWACFISEAIQSRCAVLRYSRLTDAQVLHRLLEVCEKEQVGRYPYMKVNRWKQSYFRKIPWTWVSSGSKAYPCGRHTATMTVINIGWRPRILVEYINFMCCPRCILGRHCLFKLSCVS